MGPDPAATRFFYAHVQKAAGTSLFLQLQKQFEADEIYPNAADKAPGPPGPVLLISYLRERYQARRDRIRVVAGHFPLRATELLGDTFVTMTVVRDPVERTLSYLRHHRQRTPADAELSLEALYDDPVRFHGLIHNNMVKMFSLSPEEMLAGDGLMTFVQDFDARRIDDAKTRLAGVDVLGTDVRFAAFVAELNERFGWNLDTAEHANRTVPIGVPPSFRRRIADDNAPDVELFEFAQELCARRGNKNARLT